MHRSDLWADDTILRLRRLWDEGHSTNEIGRRLGVSKNAVVGKAHRLDLPARPSPIRRDGVVQMPRKPRPPRITHSTVADLAGAAPAVIVKAPQAPRRESGRACQWITSDRAPWTFCDHSAVDGGDWCLEHLRRVYVSHRGGEAA